MNLSKKIWLFPSLLIIYEFAVNLSNDMYLPALPQLSKDFSATDQLSQLTVTTWLAGTAIAQFVLGPLSDHLGRRVVLLGGGIGFLLSTLGCALTDHIQIFLIFRFFQGTAVCSLMVAGYASIHDLFDDRNAIRVLSWMGSAAVIAPMVGPIFGGWISSASSWRIIFEVLFAIAILPLFCLWLVMPETHLAKNRTNFKLNNVIATFSRILRNRKFMMSGISSGLLYAGVMVWLTTCSLFIIETLDIDQSNFGFTQLPVFGSYMIGAAFTRRWIGRLETENLISTGLLISFISGLTMIITTFLLPKALLGVLIPMAGYSLGFGIASAPLNRITFSATLENKGSASAIFYLCTAGIGTIGSFLSSQVYNGTGVSIAIPTTFLVLLSCMIQIVRFRSIQNG